MLQRGACCHLTARNCFMSAVQRLIDEMQRRNYAAKTIKEYAASIRRLGVYFGCCPSQLSPEQIREYQLHLIRRKHVSWGYYNHTVSAIRFLYLKALRLVDRADSLREARPTATRDSQSPGGVPALAPAASVEAEVAVDDRLYRGAACFRVGATSRG